jgi:8-oxo-dGTP diphosphatase
VPVTQVIIGVIRKDDKILISQRRRGDTYPLHWEFPGGVRESGESEAECLVREIEEELGVTVHPSKALLPILVAAPKGWLVLKPYECLFLGGTPQTLECRAFRWVSPGAVSRLKFPPSNRPLIQWVRRQKYTKRLSLVR